MRSPPRSPRASSAPARLPPAASARSIARWIEGEGLDFDKLELPGRQSCVVDVESRPLVLFENEYLLGRAMEKYKGVTFISAVQPGRSHRAAA